MTTHTPRLPQDLQRHLQAELAPGERLLYAGQPNWRAEWGKYLIMIVFGVGWMSICGPMALFVWAEALGFPVTTPGKGMPHGLAIFFALFMIPFLLVGFACLAAPYQGIRNNRRTVHAATDQRILTVTAAKAVKIDSCKLAAVNFIKRHDGSNGFGSLSIGYGVEKDSDGDPRPLTQEWPGIPDAKRAEAIIRDHAKWAR
jgi:hypothetical protein